MTARNALTPQHRGADGDAGGGSGAGASYGSGSASRESGVKPEATTGRSLPDADAAADPDGRPGADADDFIADVIAAAAADRAPREAAADVLRLLVMRLGMDAGAFFLVRDDGAAEVLAVYGRTRRRGYPYPLVDGGHPRVAPLLHGVALTELDARAADLPPGLLDVASPRWSQIVLAAAEAGGTVAGLLQLSRRRPQPIDDRTRRVLRAAGHILAMAARNEALSTASERSAAVLETAYAVSRTISRSLDLERTFKLIAVNAARLVRGAHCLLFELDVQSGDLVAVASSEEDDEALVGLCMRLDDGSAFAGRTGGHLQIAVEELVWGAGMGTDLRQALSMRTALFLPMLAQNQPIGSLVLFSPTRARPFAAADVALAEEVAEQAAIAIHNARLYRDLAGSRARVESLLGRVTRVREHERRSLAAIVHDDILQSVIGAVYKLEAAVDDLPAETRPQLDEAIAVLRSAVDEARRVISDLRPPALEGLSLAAALRALADRADSLGPAKVGISIDDSLRMEPGPAAAIYRIAREAITNAQRHAAARHVWVSLLDAAAAERPAVCLTVRDDGDGFDAERCREEGHYGLTLMDEQAAFAGGSLELRSAAGAGTVVEVCIPLTAAPAADGAPREV